MRDNPLTEEEMKSVFSNFEERARKKYASLLSSGAIPENMREGGNHSPLAVAIILTAEEYNRSRIPSFRNLLANCRRFE